MRLGCLTTDLSRRLIARAFTSSNNDFMCGEERAQACDSKQTWNQPASRPTGSKLSTKWGPRSSSSRARGPYMVVWQMPLPGISTWLTKPGSDVWHGPKSLGSLHTGPSIPIHITLPGGRPCMLRSTTSRARAGRYAPQNDAFVLAHLQAMTPPINGLTREHQNGLA